MCFIVLAWVSLPKFKNLGAAVTDRIPSIMMTRSSSMSVNPFCFFIIIFCLVVKFVLGLGMRISGEFIISLV